MNFFKRLFGKNKPHSSREIANEPEAIKADVTDKKAQPSEFTTEEDNKKRQTYTTEDAFNKRYTEDELADSVLEGGLKMIEGYFEANKITGKMQKPVNCPANLDAVIEEGFGFVLYCKAFNMGEGETAGILATVFANYLVQEYGFKTYLDAEPEYPLRKMTLIYSSGAQNMRIYPIEYSAKVMNYQANYKELDSQISKAIKTLKT